MRAPGSGAVVMICEFCGTDKTVTVTITFTLTRINPRSGEESTEVKSRRLCCACGGAESSSDPEAEPLAAPGGHQQRASARRA